MKLKFKKSIAFLFCLFLLSITFTENFSCKAESEIQVNDSVQLVRERNLFFTYQSLSCLTASAIALSKNEGINDIVVLGGANRDASTIEGLRKIFNHVYIDDTSYLYDYYDNVFSAGLSANIINKIFENNVEKGAIGNIYDEGTTSYVGFPVSCQLKSKKSFLMFPEYREGTLKNSPSEQISQRDFLEAIKILYNPKPLNKNIIFNLACSGRPEFNMKLNKEIFNILKTYNDVAVKCHPCEGKHFMFPKNILEISKNKPFESFYYGFKGILISNLCSCLQTAKFMQPESIVICTEFINNENEKLKTSFSLPGNWEAYINMLKNIGVLFPKSIEELNTMVSQYMDSVVKN